MPPVPAVEPSLSTALPDGVHRVGIISMLPAVLRDLGIDPLPVLAGVGLTPGDIADPDAPIALGLMARFGMAAMAASGRGDLGLLLAAKAGTSTMGPMVRQAAMAPDVRSALAGLVVNFRLNSRWGTLALTTHDGMAILSMAPLIVGTPVAELAREVTLGGVFNIMRRLLGALWHPALVTLAYRPRVPLHVYAGFFGAPIETGALQTALVFPERDLDRPLPDADAVRHAELAGRVGAMARAYPVTFAEEIGRTIRSHLSDPALSAEWVATLHRLHRRTLARRLTAEGTSFTALHTAIRRQAAQSLMLETDATLDAIGAAVGYSEQSAFSRAFVGWTGVPPREWRRMRAPGGGHSA